MAAGLIQSAISHKYPEPGESLACPFLRLDPDGNITPMVQKEGEITPIESLFERWPNKFGRLAFGFACDHFKMENRNVWEALAQEAQARGGMLLGPYALPIQAGLGFDPAARPERMTAPALKALCQRMAQTPGWLMSALDRLESGELKEDIRAEPPPAAAKGPKTGP